jgi:exonuclease SbcD
VGLKGIGVRRSLQGTGQGVRNHFSISNAFEIAGNQLTAFKFLHAADLHLGSPFHGLALKDAEVARRFSEASRAAFTDLVSRALAEGVAFVIIAGDVYDGDWKDNTIGLYFNRELARLERAGIEIYLLKGNHDAESVVTKSITLPESVRHFEVERPTSFRIEALQVALHGQGFASRAVTDNLVTSYPPRVAGWFNVGVLHTSLTGRPPHANYAPCTPGHLRARGYDYWALGHIHDYEMVSTKPHIVFPGNLQGRCVREKGEKGAVLVSVVDGNVTEVERLIVDRARWEDVTIDARSFTSEAAILKAVEEALRPLAAIATDRLMALRVRISGETECHRQLLAHREQFHDEVQAACHRVHGDLWLEKVELKTQAPHVKRPTERAMLSVDLASLLATVDESDDMKAKASLLLAEIGVKIPGTIAEEEQDLGRELPQLIAEARELLLTRAAEQA